MKENELKNMSNSELIATLFMKRDNLVAIRRTELDYDNIDLTSLFEEESKEYEQILMEVYRRMQG